MDAPRDRSTVPPSVAARSAAWSGSAVRRRAGLPGVDDRRRSRRRATSPSTSAVFILANRARRTCQLGCHASGEDFEQPPRERLAHTAGLESWSDAGGAPLGAWTRLD